MSLSTHVARERVLSAALRVLAAGRAEPHSSSAAESEYADEQLALAARELVRATDALDADEQPVGWTEATPVSPPFTGVVYAAQAVTVDGYGDPEVVVQAAETGFGQPTGDPIARVTLDGDHTDAADLDHALAGAGFRRVSEWAPCDFGSVTTVHRAQP